MTQVLWFTVEDGPPTRRFDLSKNKCLRTLETTALSILCARRTASRFLKAVLSTTVPSLPLDVVITYQDEDLGPPLRGDRVARMLYDPGTEPYEEDDEDSLRFKVFREMYKVRSFRLVLCADVFGCALMHSMRVLRQMVAKERESGRLDYLQCEPSIISEVRAPRSRLKDCPTGDYLIESVYYSVL